MAIVYCLHKGRQILLGSQITVLTDHHALTFIQRCMLTNSYNSRWILAIQEFNLTIKQWRGKDNTMADTLSTVIYHNSSSSDTRNRAYYINKIERSINSRLIQNIKQLAHIQQTNTKLCPTIQSLQYSSNTSITPLNSQYKIAQNILFSRHNTWKIIILHIMIDELITKTHKYYLHSRPNKCIHLLQENFIFSNINRHIWRLLATCDTCQKCKYPNQTCHGLTKGIKTYASIQQLSIEKLATDKRGLYYLTHDGKHFFKIRNNIPHTASHFNDYLPKYKQPLRIHKDYGIQFTANKWTEILIVNGIQPVFSPLSFTKQSGRMHQKRYRKRRDCHYQHLRSGLRHCLFCKRTGLTSSLLSLSAYTTRQQDILHSNFTWIQHLNDSATKYFLDINEQHQNLELKLDTAQERITKLSL